MFFFWHRKKSIRHRTVLPKHKYTTGEKYYVWGKAYEIVVVKGTQASVTLDGEHLLLCMVGTNTQTAREEQLDAWLKEQLAPRLAATFVRAGQIVGKSQTSYYIRKMTTRWGTCNFRTGRVCINLRLAHLDPEFLNYIVIHELTHLWESSHGPLFKEKMDAFYPNWRVMRKRIRLEMDQAF
jgi:predicted metal-dependent hydrolase